MLLLITGHPFLRLSLLVDDIVLETSFNIALMCSFSSSHPYFSSSPFMLSPGGSSGPVVECWTQSESLSDKYFSGASFMKTYSLA